MVDKITVMYDQPKLPWFKRMFGMEYGPGWRIGIMKIGQPETLIWSDRQPKSPNPADVMVVYTGVIHEFTEKDGDNGPQS